MSVACRWNFFLTTDTLGRAARDLLTGGVEELGLQMAPDSIAKLDAFLGHMARWNKRIGLTAITDPAEMVIRHGLDSLSVEPFLRGPRVIDVGTGPGLPGVPLAIARPDLQFTLLDSLEKRMTFVRQAVWEIGLENVEVVTSRVQAYRPEAKFDTLVSRAFSSLDETMARSIHLVQGRFVAMKGHESVEEIADLKSFLRDALLVHGGLRDRVDKVVSEVESHSIEVPGLDAARSVVVVDIDQDHGCAHEISVE